VTTRTLTIGAVPHAPDGSGYYRFFLPGKHLGENSRHLYGMPERPGAPFGPQDVEGLDVLALQRPAGRSGTRMLERLVGRVKLVYETDDDMLRVEASGLPHLYEEQARESIRRCLRLVDMVTVSTPYLAEQVRPYCENVVVLPNMVKAGLLDLHRPKAKKLTIGWAGGTSHLVDIVTVADPLRDVLLANPDVDVHWMGFDYSPELTRGRLDSPLQRQCRHTLWRPDVGEYYKRIDFDIAIAPLADVPFNDSKSPIRALEMAACGIPIVASDRIPYSEFVADGKTGWLVSNDEEWKRRLTDLINDPDMRQEMGMAAKLQAADWLIEDNWRLWESAYEAVANL
jgi:glycosyltransferase involved in cell wall biosynthesis